MADFDFEVDLVEYELIDVTLNEIDLIPQQGGSNNDIIFNESPTKLSAVQYQTAHAYLSGSLVVYFNGIKEKHITENSNSLFSLPISTITEDEVEVSYIKL